MADEPKSKWAPKAQDEAELFRQSTLFLVHLRKHGRPVQAAREAGFVNTEYVNAFRRTDKEFADAWASVLEARKDLIEDAIIERAVHGIERPVMFQGKQVDHPNGTPMFERTYSDGLLIAAAKAEMPEKYGEKAKVEHHHTGKVGVAILPMRMTSIADFEQELQALDVSQRPQLSAPAEKALDATFEEVKPGPTEIRRG
jgi:hypothetical protein